MYFKQSVAICLCFIMLNAAQAQSGRAEDINAPTQTEFLKKHASIDSLHWENYHTIILFLKNNLKETYDLDVSDNRQTFYKKYGSPPLPPPRPNSRVSRRQVKK